MSALSPFAYPSAPHARAHHPTGYDSVERYKQWLRDEFRFLCVYCLEREAWYPDRSASFSIDHIIPQSVAPALLRDYSNLAYCCTRCNSAKQDVRLLDPTTEAMGGHLRLGDGAVMVGLTSQGLRLIEKLGLNEPQAAATRRKHLRLLVLKERYPDDPDIHALFHHAFGWPDDMPDLRRALPPGGNANEGSEERCHFARRERGELPAVY